MLSYRLKDKKLNSMTKQLSKHPLKKHCCYWNFRKFPQLLLLYGSFSLIRNFRFVGFRPSASPELISVTDPLLWTFNVFRQVVSQQYHEGVVLLFLHKILHKKHSIFSFKWLQYSSIWNTPTVMAWVTQVKN